VCLKCRRKKIGCEVCSDESLNCVINYAYQISQETRLNFGRLSTFSDKAGTKKKTDNRANEITQVEENDDNYDSMRVK
jgi:hypothetical protein